MKNLICPTKKFFRIAVTSFILLLLFSFNCGALAATNTHTVGMQTGDPKNLVFEFIQAVNNNDIQAYISLFTNENQREMNKYIKEIGPNNFFKEESIALINLTRLSNNIGEKSANISNEENKKYKDTVVYYAEENIQFKQDNGLRTDDILDSGYNYRNYVIVREGDQWKLLRVSSPDIVLIDKAKEGFGSKEEKAKINQLKEKINITKNISMISSSTDYSVSSFSSTHPSSITVYFTKSANRNHFGADRASVAWYSYMTNVIPNEWTVDYYSQHEEYLIAGACASNMYAWWYQIHPKWNSAPYYACVMDNSNDQNYLYGSLASLSSTYQSYVLGAYQVIRDVAMYTAGSESLFEVHYHATDGGYHSGQMSASGCWNLAKQGKTFGYILAYYYSYSTYTGNQDIKVRNYVNGTTYH